MVLFGTTYVCSLLDVPGCISGTPLTCSAVRKNVPVSRMDQYPRTFVAGNGILAGKTSVVCFLLWLERRPKIVAENILNCVSEARGTSRLHAVPIHLKAKVVKVFFNCMHDALLPVQ